MTPTRHVESITAVADTADPGATPASQAARLTQLLSVEIHSHFDDVALARRVSDGLPVRSVSRLAEMIGKARIVGPVVPEPTLRRAQKARKPLSREHSERLYELSRVLDAVDRAYHGDRAQLTAFLTRPHPLLDGETPLDMTRSSSAGADAVLNLLRRADAGVAV